MNKALKELNIGLAYARADYNPQWHGMGRCAEKAMAVYPPMVAWRKINKDWEDKALELAETPEFHAFLVEMFPEEEDTPQCQS